MANFQEFIQKRQEQRNAGQQTQQNLSGMAGQSQAAGNQAQQPQPLYTKGGGSARPGTEMAAPMQAQGGSSVNSSGRLTAGGPPPLWQQQQAQQQQSWLTQMQNQPKFDPNNFQAVTSEGDKNYWQWAMKEQNGINDFWGTLTPGTPVSGSPGKVWVQGPDGSWGTATAPKEGTPPAFPTSLPQWQGQYNPAQFSQWQGPQQQEFEQGAGDLMAYLLQNPNSMSDENVAQLKQVQNDLLTQLSKNSEQGILGDLAARGMSGGGMETGLLNQNQQQMNSAILAAQRDIDLKKMTQDRADQLGILGAADSYMTGQMGRASEDYANALRGQSLNDSSRQFAAQQGAAQSGFEQGQFNNLQDYLMQLYGIQNTNKENEANRTFTGTQNQLNRDLQQRLADAGLGLDYSRLNWDKEQFKQTFPLQQAQVLGGLGIDMANLNLRRDQFTSDDEFRRTQSALDWLLGR